MIAPAFNFAIRVLGTIAMADLIVKAGYAGMDRIKLAYKKAKLAARAKPRPKKAKAKTKKA